VKYYGWDNKLMFTIYMGYPRRSGWENWHFHSSTKKLQIPWPMMPQGSVASVIPEFNYPHTKGMTNKACGKTSAAQVKKNLLWIN